MTKNRFLFAGTATLVMIATLFAKAEPRHTVTYSDLKTLKGVSWGDLSPDGKWLAYEIDDGVLWIVATEPGSVPRKVGIGSFPGWSPDSRHLAYYAALDGRSQLWVYSIMSNHTEPATRMKGGVDPQILTTFIGSGGWANEPLQFSWSPDGLKLVFASRAAGTGSTVAHSSQQLRQNGQPGQPLVFDNTTPPLATVTGLFPARKSRVFKGGKLSRGEDDGDRADQLFIVDIHTKAVRQLTTDDAIYFTPAWSPDGSTIVCVSMEGRPLSGHYSGPTNLYLIDVKTSEKRAVTTDKTVYKRVPKFSPDGRWIAYMSQTTPGDLTVSVIAARGGPATDIAGKLDRRPELFAWSSKSSVIVQFSDGRTRPIAQIDVSTREITIPISGPAFRMILGVSRDGGIAWCQNDFAGPARLYLLKPGSVTPLLLVDLNPQIAGWELGSQEIVHWKNSRGDDLDGILLKPIGYMQGQRYPLILDAYPQVAIHFLGFLGEGNQLWASRGYAVFFPSSRGPHVWMNAFRSSAFDEAAKGPEGIDVMVDDIMTGIDALIREGVVDDQRMGLLGFSNGGAVVNYLVTRTKRFRCAISQSPAISTNWISTFLDNTLYQIPAEMAGAPPWDSPETWMKLSVVLNLDKVTTPMLLAVGDAEGSAALHTIELYNGLRFLGRDVTLLRYPHQGHGFTGAAGKDFFNRELQFFDRYLRARKN